MALDNVDPPKLKGSLTKSYNNAVKSFNQPYFLDMVTAEKLILQTVPLQIGYDPGQVWGTVASPGRNNPLYQYTGAEDTITFTISWYADELSREDVLRKTKWIESLSKNNGYDEKPHRVKFVMGKLFLEAYWVIISCPVNWSLFNRAEGMLPCLASQEITLKRIMTTNRSQSQIRDLRT
jgi:hypothetical protein